jgi:large subunit ribosomal protein L2
MPSGELRSFSLNCFVTLGELIIKPKLKLFKAGFNRNLGFRPIVRGVAKNPIDHPHGGKTAGGRPSVSPYSIYTKGFRTKKKDINKNIIKRRFQIYEI